MIAFFMIIVFGVNSAKIVELAALNYACSSELSTCIKIINESDIKEEMPTIASNKNDYKLYKIFKFICDGEKCKVEIGILEYSTGKYCPQCGRRCIDSPYSSYKFKKNPATSFIDWNIKQEKFDFEKFLDETLRKTNIQMDIKHLEAQLSNCSDDQKRQELRGKIKSLRNELYLMAHELIDTEKTNEIFLLRGRLDLLEQQLQGFQKIK